MSETSDLKMWEDKFDRVARILKEYRETGQMVVTDAQLDECIEVQTYIQRFFAVLGEGTLVNGLAADLNGLKVRRGYRQLDKNR
jgi:hypothetical protein